MRKFLLKKPLILTFQTDVLTDILTFQTKFLRSDYCVIGFELGGQKVWFFCLYRVGPTQLNIIITEK